MFSKFTSRQFFIILACLYSLGIITMNSSDSVNAQNSPNNPQRPERSRWLKPMMPPEGAVEYNVIASEASISGRFGLPAARLVNPPSKLAQEIAVLNRSVGIEVDGTRRQLPSESPTASIESVIGVDQKADIIISSVRYRGSGHTIYINTAVLSPATATQKHTLGTTTQLADGTTAGVYISNDDKTPNQLVLIKGKVYVTIASDLPMEQVKDLATKVVLK
jgi:hypothetical protein